MRRYLRSLIRRRPRTRPSKNSCLRNERRRLQVDPLEERRLLTVSAIFSGSDLTVTGDANANNISITFEDVSGTDYLIVKDGVTTIFDGTPSDQNVETSEVSGITVSGAAGDDTLTLVDVNTTNSFSLSGGNVLVSGGDDDDTITGSAFHDSLTGGGGNDTYVFGSGTFGGDLVTEAANSDTDVLDFSAFGAGISLDLSSTSNQVFSGGSYVHLSDATGIENVTATAFGDLLTGNSRNNRIEGGDGGNVIDGGAGNDTLLGGNDTDILTGGAGDDLLDGGAGNDIYRFVGSSLDADTVDESSSNGDDILDFSEFGHAVSIDLRISAQQDIDESGTNLKLTITDPTEIKFINGSDYADSLTGNSGNNAFQGNGGNDTLIGLGGDDYYLYEDSGYGADTIEEVANADNDVLDFSGASVAVSLDLNSTSAQSWNGGTIDLSSGTGIEVVNGSSGNDVIIGNARDNILSGLGGHDSITGAGGDDTVLGGAGNDTIVTGSGNEVVDGGADIDALLYVGTSGVDVIGSSPSTIAFDVTSINDVTPTAVEALDIDTGDNVDLVAINESYLAGMGFLGFFLDTGAGNDSVSLNIGHVGSFVGMLFGSVLDLGDGNDNVIIEGVSGTPSLGADVNGGAGDDTLEVRESAANGLAEIDFDGGADNDTLTIRDIVSSTVTVYDDRIGLSGSEDVEFSTTENLVIDSDDSTAHVITVGESTVALPAIAVTGDSTDTLDVTSAPGGTIDSTYSSVSSETSFVVDTNIADITSSGIKDFELDSQTITFDGISADQYYDVTTNFIDPGTMQLDRDGHLYFEGALSVAGVTPASHATLINNNSNAILHGGFTDDSDIEISMVKYDVQYVSDVDFDDHEVSGGVQVTTSSIETNLETIPRFLYNWMATDASDVNRSIASGDWSTASNWSFGVVPTADDLVQITPGTTITYDANNAVDDLKGIEILGSLVFDTTIDTHLLVGTIEVLPGGKLEIGSASAPISSSKEAIVTFANHIVYDNTVPLDNPDPEQHATGLLGFGEVTIHGSAIGTYSSTAAQTWVRLSEVVDATDTELKLETALPTGWDEGDFIVLPDTRQLTSTQDHLYDIGDPGVASETEVLEIKTISMDRKTITLEVAAQYDHFGGQNFQQQDTSSTSYETYPHIAILDRNVTLTSEDPDGYRGHTLYGGRADVDIRYANFEDLGRVVNNVPLGDDIDVDTPSGVVTVPNQIARYGVHFHHLFGPVNPTNTGHQFAFVGNTAQSNQTWGVTVHGTSYGLIADNVVYDVEGAGYVTEDGNEIGNEFLNNISVKVTGTLRDGELGGDNPADDPVEHGIARGGSGFWFRRSGNDIIGNVAADNMYSGMTITSYYQFDELKLPDFRGANPTTDSTLTLVNPAGTIDDNEFYGKSKFGLWIAYVSGDNIGAVAPPEVVFEDLTLWHAGLNSFITMYHTANTTFDNLLILSDTDTQTREDSGVVGIDMRVYENINTQILDSRIEGTHRGIIHTPSTFIPFGGALVGTLVDNTVLKNYINVTVLPSKINRVGAGNYIELKDTVFTTIDLPEAPAGEGLDIRMAGEGNSTSDDLMFNEFSIVKVTNYNQEAGENFQVFYHEQEADHIMETTDWSWFLRFGNSQVGAPAGSFYTNDEMWGDDTGDPFPDLNLATFGFVAPSNASASNSKIDGLVGAIDEFLDPTTEYDDPMTTLNDAKVVIATPWDGSSFIGENSATNDVPINFNILGLVPEGGRIKFQVKEGSTVIDTRDGPLNDGLWQNLDVGSYTLRGYIVEVTTEIIGGEEVEVEVEVPGSSHLVSFSILEPQAVDVTLTPLEISNSENEVDDIIGGTDDDVIGPALEIRQMLLAAGGVEYLNQGMAIIAESSPQGVWQYKDPDPMNGWTDFPSVSSTSALVLPYGANVRFVVDGSVTNPHNLAAPTLDFVMWDDLTDMTDLAYDTGVDATTTHFSTDVVTVTLPLEP